jgi:hypothetical protein
VGTFFDNSAIAIMTSPAGRATESPGPRSSAAIILGRQLKQMQSDKDIPGISCGLVDNNIFEWEVMLMLSDEQDSLYGGESAMQEKLKTYTPVKSRVLCRTKYQQLAY